MMMGCLLVSTLAGLVFFRMGLSDSTIILIYILGVVVCTKMTDGAVYGLIASFSAVLLFNYFLQCLITLSRSMIPIIRLHFYHGNHVFNHQYDYFQ